MSQDLIRAQHIRLDGHGVGMASQNVLAERRGNLIVIHVDDATRWVDSLGDLMHAADGRNPGSQIEKLADALVDGKRHRASEEGTIGAEEEGEIRLYGEHPFRRGAIDREVVITTQKVVIHARIAGTLLGIEPGSGSSHAVASSY